MKFEKASANISYATKETTWSSIVEKVNAVGVTRTVNQVMKRQSDPGFEYAGSSSSCPSPPKVFLPHLNKSQVLLHQEVYHSSQPEANDRADKLRPFGDMQVEGSRLSCCNYILLRNDITGFE
ncbi:UNVERIFIED_CONTAM: hypothetical protein FKN15_060431 [Acipenser sinensis]